MGDPDGCPARLSFPSAPYLDLQCEHPPGHGPGIRHVTRARVRTMLEPYSSPAPFRDTRGVTTVWLAWQQDVGDVTITTTPPEGPT